MKNASSSLATSARIAQPYNLHSLQQKPKNKTMLQQQIGWPSEPRRPVACLPMGMTDDLGGKLLEEVLPGLLMLPLEFLVLGKGAKKYGQLFSDLQKKEDHRFHIVPADDASVEQMYAASDMALFFADPFQNTKELEQLMQYAVVPVAPKHTGLADYDPVQEKGTAFLYEKETKWHCFGAVIRALETYKFPFDWKTIQKQVMKGL